MHGMVREQKQEMLSCCLLSSGGGRCPSLSSPPSPPPSLYLPWQVLTSLGGITSDSLVAFELLWTPQVGYGAY